jgi:hypothetical protein
MIIKKNYEYNIRRVAFRSNGMRFINPLAHLLPDETLVIALDNTPQGVYTIGDIKEVIEKTDPTAEYWRTVKV